MTGKATGLTRRRRALGVTALGLVGVTAAAVVGGPASFGGSAAAAQASTLETVQALADDAVSAGVPGVIVRVNDGRGPAVSIARQGSWTVADHRLAASDQFRMGSNTKTLTATLVLQLVAQHRVRLDDSIEKWLPGAVPNGRNITIRMLLNHTSGLADYAYERESIDLMTGRQQQKPTAKQMLALGTRLPPVAAPGVQWHYSNTGYVALGLMLEKATGLGLAEQIDRRIVQPLRLQHTYLATGPTPPSHADRLAAGYEPGAAQLAPLLPPGLPAGYGFVGPEHDGMVDVAAIDQSFDGAAGAVVSTAEDWARFDAALMSGRLFPSSLLSEMRTDRPDEASGPGHFYGLGLERYESPCGTVWGHEGALPGYRSDNYTDESGRRTVSVLSTTRFGLMANPAAGTAFTGLLDGAICAMFGKAIPSNPTGSAQAAPPPKSDLAAAVGDVHDLGVTGVQGITRIGGRTTTERSGVANTDTSAPVPDNGYFRMGSNTKTFVAVVLLQLVGEGKLSLDDRVQRWLPGVVTGNGNDGSRITVRQLLQHTSGVPEYLDDLPVVASPEGYRAHRLDRHDPRQLVAVAMKHPPLFAPGTSWSYSNTNYILAGMIIKKVTGRSWDKEVRSRILEPLHLNQTYAPGGDPTLREPHAEAYHQFEPGGPLVDTTITNPTAADAAGALVTTPADLARFWQALQSGRLLTPAEMAQMHQTVPAPGLAAVFPGARYGLGIIWSEDGCGGHWSHGGDVPGTKTMNAVSPDGKKVVVLSETTELADPRPVYERVNRLNDKVLCS
ncbi:serine hydrolase domain-containing protein [Actinoplanes sp. NPDC049265]|uniref:serine hydrolase domain-containing protein n=1 Tax=Actinoplanes sp. NPDC049265 TaxID=3363902 RepID=UPI003710B3A4